jgi:hypothetical protein
MYIESYGKMPFDLFQPGSSYTLMRQDGLTVNLPQALRTKRYVILFIAGQWWAPCRGVTVQLKSFYENYCESHDFEVIFLSTDRSEGAMLDFFHDTHGDWLCLRYKDARNLDAALASDKDLHPKQVPACLVFEVDRGALMKHSTVQKPREDGKDTPAAVPLPSAAAAPSFVRLTTKHGREMLSRDKEGALFPWYDDGWCDTAAWERSVSLRRCAAACTPSPTAPPACAAATAPVEDDAEHGNSITRAKHVDVVLHTNPHSPPPSRTSAVTTPSTQPIIKHPPATVGQAHKHAEAPKTEKEPHITEHEKHREEGGDEAKGSTSEVCDAAAETVATAAEPAEDVDASPTAHRDDSRTPMRCRQLCFSRTPESRDDVQPKSSPPRVIVVERTFASKVHAVEVKKGKERSENEDQGTTHCSDDNGINKIGNARQADVELYEALQARISAVMEEIGSDDACSASGEEELAADAHVAPEPSAAEREVPATAPQSQSADKAESAKRDAKDEEGKEKEVQPRKSTGWKALIGL